MSSVRRREFIIVPLIIVKCDLTCGSEWEEVALRFPGWIWGNRHKRDAAWMCWYINARYSFHDQQAQGRDSGLFLGGWARGGALFYLKAGKKHIDVHVTAGFTCHSTERIPVILWVGFHCMNTWLSDMNVGWRGKKILFVDRKTKQAHYPLLKTSFSFFSFNTGITQWNDFNLRALFDHRLLPVLTLCQANQMLASFICSVMDRCEGATAQNSKLFVPGIFRWAEQTLTLFVEDPSCDETYEKAHRHDAQWQQQPPLSLCRVWPAWWTTAVQIGHLCTQTHKSASA